MEHQLTKAYDSACLAVFTGANSSFFGSLLCSVNLVWDDSIPTAYVSKSTLGINPDLFLELPKGSRSTLIAHELNHIGRLHLARMGSRDPQFWNWACDISINNDLKNEGHSFEGLEFGIFDPDYEGWLEEDIYEDLIKNHSGSLPETYRIHSDIGSTPDPEEAAIHVDMVVQAVTVSKLGGNGIPGGIEVFIDKLLNPVLPLEEILRDYLTELDSKRINWSKRNRRYRSVVVPTRTQYRDRLSDPTFYFDVSGSISLDQATRMISEVYEVARVFEPEHINIVQFTTQITKEQTIKHISELDGFSIVGRGGTNLECVREHVNRTKPSYAIIFSDLHCLPMDPIETDSEIIWVVLGNPSAKVSFGKAIHLDKEL